MILLLPTSDTDLLSARAAGDAVPCRSTSPARPSVHDLPALVEGADLAVLRHLGGVRSWDGSPDALVAVPPFDFGEIAASTCAAIARETGIA